MVRTFFFIFSFLLLLSSIQCAKRGRPTGGLKDTIPPVLISASPKMRSINFDKNKITLTFNEFVKLKEIGEQLVISPPLGKDEYKIHPESNITKKIQIRLLKKLHPKTTYTFNFGQSIEDYNENNPVPFFSYTFSTGDFIDSLSVSGEVESAYSSKLEDHVSIYLYPIDSTFTDSTIYKKKPLYVGTTLDTITFRIDNIRAGKYEFIAIKDVLSNYYFDSHSDEIAFFNEPIELPRDSIVYPVLFKETPEFQWGFSNFINDHHIQFGYYGERLDRELRLLSEVPDDFESIFVGDAEADTLHYWFKNAGKIDSLVFEMKGRDSLERKTLKLIEEVADSLVVDLFQKRKLDLLDTLQIESSLPLVKVNDSLIEIKEEDSISIPFQSVINKYRDRAYINFDKVAEKKYKINVLPNAFIDFFGNTNDSLSYSFNVPSEEEYGAIKVTLTMESDFPYFLELINKRGKVVYKKTRNESDSYVFPLLPAGKYSLRMVKDDNENNRWDTGNYLKRRQPEEVIYISDELELRANWELIEDFIIE